MEDQDQDQYVNLNVGGTHYMTSLSTLMKGETMLSAMFSGRIPLQKDANGNVLIDRDGKQFYRILNYLRDGDISLPETQTELDELKKEAKFYCIDDLIELCESDSSPSKRKETKETMQNETNENMRLFYMEYLKRLYGKMDRMCTELTTLNFKNGSYEHQPASMLDQRNRDLWEATQNILGPGNYYRGFDGPRGPIRQGPDPDLVRILELANRAQREAVANVHRQAN